MTELTGRRAERAVLDRLADDVRAGASRVLVVHGEPGTGKTALLDYLAGRASGCRVVRAAGVRPERNLSFAGLHRFCAPLARHLDRLPAPQRDALRAAFGLTAGAAPDRFLVGLAVLGLLSDAPGGRPLLCLIDDQHWLDPASAQVLAFAARRLGPEPVGMVFGARTPEDGLAGLPALRIGGLREDDARALLDSALAGPLDARVRDQILAETGGNPLALLELARGPAELAGGFGLPGAVPPGGAEDGFRRRGAALPAAARRLLLLAAADPAGDPALVWRAAARLGLGADAAVPATEAGMVEFGARVRFRHPLARSAAYRSAPARERREAHRALAEATDQAADPDRRAWHRAQAAAGPDEDAAGDLERCAARARERGGPAAAAAFLERAAALTLDPAARARRALAAAGAKAEAGAFDAARSLLAAAGAGPLGERHRAAADLLRARIALADRGGDAPSLLLSAARRLAPVDAGLSRAAHLDALAAALSAGRLTAPGGAREAAVAAAAAPRPPRDPDPSDLLLDGLASLFTEGAAAALPVLRRALAGFCRATPADGEPHRLWPACLVAAHLWDDAAWDTLSERYIRLAREAGALGELPLALDSRARMLLFAGDLAGAAALLGEARAVREATGSGLGLHGAPGLAALRGRAEGASEPAGAPAGRAAEWDEDARAVTAAWADAVLGNGLGRYREAMAAAQRALAHRRVPGAPHWAAAELVEAAVRCGACETAAGALRLLGGTAGGTDWALGVEARSRALPAAGPAAERLYREAITRLGRTRVRAELARAHLLYGEWLRRERRRTDAREQLRTARRMLRAMGMAAFAERAGRELRAAGDGGRGRVAVTRDEPLTAQEAQIARLARDGLSNPEIGTRLFISPRTVQYHLRKVFAKLGITSRSQLDRVLP